MKTLQKFNRTIIEALSFKGWDDIYMGYTCENCWRYYEHDIGECKNCLGKVVESKGMIGISISQVIKALENKLSNAKYSAYLEEIIDRWQLTKPDGYTTATSEDQSEETLKKILELIK